MGSMDFHIFYARRLPMKNLYSELLKDWRNRYFRTPDGWILDGKNGAEIEQWLLKSFDRIREETARECLLIVDEASEEFGEQVPAVKIGFGDAKIVIAEGIAIRFKLWHKYKSQKAIVPDKG